MYERDRLYYNIYTNQTIIQTPKNLPPTSPPTLHTVLLGRLIFGLGGECLVVGQSAFISAWFHGREVAFALGFVLSVSRLGR